MMDNLNILKMKIYKLIGSTFFSGLLVIGFVISSTSPAQALEEENPWKIVWQECPAGSAVSHVIRCKEDGGEECFANWQYFCDENP